MNTQLDGKVKDIYPRLVDIRRHLHQNPELSFQEYETTDFIKRKLDELGIPYETPMDTGVIGIIKGKDSRGTDAIALRADIDALPIEEEGDHKREFFSKRPGAAHCCGHDLHTANLLGAAELIISSGVSLDYDILLIFQAAEECLPGGGKLLKETGFLDRWNIKAIYGLHSYPELPPGEIGIRNGPFMARADEFELTISAEGGHAAAPHTTVDPIVVGSQWVSEVQTIVSRNVMPAEPAVVTVGYFHGGTAHNVIPEKVELMGTIRSFSDDISYLIHQRLRDICKGYETATGARMDLNINEGYPAVLNDEEAVDRIENLATELLGASAVHRLTYPVMAGEDFAFYLRDYPGSFFFLGTGSKEANSQYGWHHPRYNVDERAMQTGTVLMAQLALNG